MFERVYMNAFTEAQLRVKVETFFPGCGFLSYGLSFLYTFPDGLKHRCVNEDCYWVNVRATRMIA